MGDHKRADKDLSVAFIPDKRSKQLVDVCCRSKTDPIATSEVFKKKHAIITDAAKELNAKQFEDFNHLVGSAKSKFENETNKSLSTHL